MHVVVLGAGLAGLATALRLARAGCAVTVLEAAAQPGGRGRSTVHEGTVLNLGPHALYSDALAELASLGVPVSAHVPKLSPRLLVGGELVSGLNLARLAPWVATQVLRDPTRLAGLTVGEWLDRCPAATRDRAAALVRLTTYCAREDLDAAAAAHQVRAAAKGVCYADGGWQAVVDALVGAVREAGGTLRTGAPAVALAGTDVVLRDEVLRADAVVVATSADRARELVDGLPAPEVARAACLDVALSRLPRPSPSFVLGVDEPLYLSVHSGTADLGPGAVVHVAAYGEAPRERLEALLDQAQPGWRELAVHARYLPRMAVMHGVPVVGWRRPDPVVRPGVVLAGDWVGDGMLAYASLSSARRAAEAVLAHEEVRAA